MVKTRKDRGDAPLISLYQGTSQIVAVFSRDFASIQGAGQFVTEVAIKYNDGKLTKSELKDHRDMMLMKLGLKSQHKTPKPCRKRPAAEIVDDVEVPSSDDDYLQVDLPMDNTWEESISMFTRRPACVHVAFFTCVHCCMSVGVQYRCS